MYDIENLCIWGNHSPTMYPDLSNCRVKGKPAFDLVSSEWYEKDFVPTV